MRKFFWRTVGVLAFILIWYSVRQIDITEEIKNKEKKTPTVFVESSASKFRRGSQSSVIIDEIIVGNSGSVGIKDITLECKFITQSGAVLHVKKSVLNQEIGRLEKKLFTNIDLGFIDSQANAVRCDVVGYIEM